MDGTADNAADDLADVDTLIDYGARPNFVFILADDLGWANVGFKNPWNAQILTPNIDGLAMQGLELQRMYVYKGCAPSRSALQSGRLPVHITTDTGDGITNPAHGLPLG